MIKINDEYFELKELNCQWGSFSRTYRSITKNGIAPRLFFIVDGCDTKELLLELTITDEEFKNMPVGKELDLKEEVVDIGYVDSKGWLSLNGKEYTLKITRLNLDKFLISFKYGDTFEEISFEIEEEINLEFPKED